MPKAKILLVDDDEKLRAMLAKVLEGDGYAVTPASCVADALKLISSDSFDVLLSDLHMPGKGDGLTVISAMRHANPKAVTMLLSAFPEMGAATQAILMQADQILVKPMNIPALLASIEQRLAAGAPPPHAVESVATILEESVGSTVEAWFERVEQDKKVMVISMSRQLRSGHLPTLLMDLVTRLRSFRALGSKELVSKSAEDHGKLRRQQGYTPAMLVEESRMLQVSIFETLQKNLFRIDFSTLLDSVMTIADEVDSQLSQAMESYIEEAIVLAKPAQ